VFGSRIHVSLVAAVAILLTLTPAAEAKFLDQAKFKLLSMSGSEAVTFSEDSTTSTGSRCVGTTSARIGFRSLERPTVYVFLKQVHGDVRTILAPDPDPRNFDLIYLHGEATISRSVSYQETAGCDQQAPPTDCPETTVPAEPFILGTAEPSGGVGASGERTFEVPSGYPEDCDNLTHGFGSVGVPNPTVSTQAIPRKQLFNEKRARLEDSVAVEEPLAKTVGPPSADTGTASGTYKEELSVELKRLKLKEDEKRG
jgi:hypothetical protein